jgi:hypothetical protein
MRRLILTSSALLACTPDKIADPFQVSATDPSTDDGADESGGEDETSSTGDVDPTGDPTVDPTMPELDTSGDGDGSEESTAEAPDVCGDGILGPNEPCDGELFGESSCMSSGFNGGVLVCDDLCQGYSTAGCYNCGDGTIDGTEDCDGPLADNVTCASAGYTEGTISCDPRTCLYDVSQCSLCGDGMISGSELCDSDDLDGTTCATLGFDGGELACNAESCGFDFTACEGGAYFQDFESGAFAPEFSLGGDADWIVTMTGAIAGSWSAASGVITHNQSSNLALTVTFSVPGSVEFTHTESTENNYDYLEFWVDGAMLQEWSGSNGPATVSFDVAAGMHEIEWRYTKDLSVNTGSDRVWIDDITITNGAPAP